LTADQIILFVLLFFVFVFLIWGRWRYDLVAFFALMVALLAGVIPTDQAFSGFGHSAVVIIALVLIVSRGLSNSGAIELLARFVVSKTRKLAAHIGIMSSLAAVLSALMNNEGQEKPGAFIDAPVIRLDPGRHDHADRHTAQYHHRRISQ
jgi:di/tricarboxylate transporter